MNTKTRKITTSAALLLTLCLFLLSQTASAQNKCLNVHGKLIDVSNGGQLNGTITEGGILNGTTVSTFTGGPSTTPDPTTISLTRNQVITTVQGELKADITALFTPAMGWISEIGRIDPALSTGRFAGATGVLFASGKFDFLTSTAELDITGEVCFADE